MSHPSTNVASYARPTQSPLTPEDVQRLLREDSPDSRIHVLDKITRHYAEGNFQHTELEYAEQIFRLLMKDAEVKVRQALSVRLQNNPDIPRDIALHLAQDVEQVALPILQASQVLSDADLIHLIETSREISKLMAISQRDHLSERVSHSLVETHYPEVVTSLLKNEGAAIGDQDYEDILRLFPDDESVTAAMVQRAQLPLSVAEKLIGHVSGALAEELEQRYDLHGAQLGEQAREHLTLEMLTEDTADQQIERVVDQMIESDRMTPSIILSSLARGQLRFFEIALARLANIPHPNAQKLIHDRGQLGFQALYQKTEMPESLLGAVKVLLHVTIDMQEKVAKLTPSQYANQVVQQVLKRADGTDIENIPYIIALVRQSAN